VTTCKRDRERAELESESRVLREVDLNIVREAGAHKAALPIEASTATSSDSMKSAKRAAIQALACGPQSQLLGPVRRRCRKTCVQNRSVKIIKFGSKLPTTRMNASSQAACSVDDASALSGVSKKRRSDKNVIFHSVG
jgi:hypothetical protein